VGRPGFIARAARAEALHELVEDRPLDVDALGPEADLAAVGEGGAGDDLERQVHVAVGEDDGRVLAAELHRRTA
jgi:hypothetical protein